MFVNEYFFSEEQSFFSQWICIAATFNSCQEVVIVYLAVFLKFEEKKKVNRSELINREKVFSEVMKGCFVSRFQVHARAYVCTKLSTNYVVHIVDLCLGY